MAASSRPDSLVLHGDLTTEKLKVAGNVDSHTLSVGQEVGSDIARWLRPGFAQESASRCGLRTQISEVGRRGFQVTHSAGRLVLQVTGACGVVASFLPIA